MIPNCPQSARGVDPFIVEVWSCRVSEHKRPMQDTYHWHLACQYKYEMLKINLQEKTNILNNNKDVTEMMSDEKGTVTVIRVETSVSEDTESHLDDATEEENDLTLADKEDNFEETATTTEETLDDAVTTTEASDVTTDK